jgi:hypothetical protein
VRDSGRSRNSTRTHSKKAHKYDKATERQEKYIETFRLSRHHVCPFFSRQVTLESIRGVQGLIFSWPTGILHTMSVPEAGANKQDMFLINPGRVYDMSWTCV